MALSAVTFFKVNSADHDEYSEGLFTLTAATATETQIFFSSRMGYIGPHGSVHTETCGKGNSNPSGLIQTILSVAVAAVSVNEP